MPAGNSVPAKLPFGYITAEELSPSIGLTVERIFELVESGHFPHHRYDDKGPFFRRLAEKKGSPRIDYEEVLVVRKAGAL